MEREEVETCWHDTMPRVLAYHLRSRRRQLQLADRIELLASTAVTPQDAAVTAHVRAEALRTLAALPEQDREALLLIAWDGLSTEQAAAVLGCRPSALRPRLHRVRKRLDATVAQPIDSPDFTARSSR